MNPSSLFLDTIIYNVLYGYKRDNKSKNFKNIMSLQRYSIMNADMADMTCRNLPSRIFINIGAYITHFTSK